MKLSVLYITSTLGRSGPTNQLYNLINNLDDKLSVIVLTLSPEPEDSRWQDFKKLEIELLTLNRSRIAGFFLNESELKTKFNSFNPDVIHSQGIRGDSLNASLETSKPQIATIHNFPQYDYPSTYGKVLGNIMVRNHLKKMKKLNLCVGVSDSVAENLKTNFNINNVCSVQNGVDTSEFNPVSASKKLALRKKLGLPLEKDIWISLGHLSDRKDPITIVNSFREISKKNDNQFLLLLGDGELKAECIDISRSMDSICFTGRVKNVAQYLQASDYFISASKAEGLPMAVIEAMACGLPVLLSDIKPHLEVLRLNRKAGKSFKLRSNKDLQNNIKRLQKKNYEQMREASLQIVKNKLSANIMSKHYKKLYHNLSGVALNVVN